MLSRRKSLILLAITLLFFTIASPVCADSETITPLVIPYYITSGSDFLVCVKPTVTTCIPDTTSFYMNYSYENWSQMYPLPTTLDINESYDSDYFCSNLTTKTFTHDADPTYVSLYKTQSGICSIDENVHNIKVIDYDSTEGCVSIVIDGAISDPKTLCAVSTTKSSQNSVDTDDSDTAYIQWTQYSANRMTFRCDSDERISMIYTTYDIKGGCLDKYDAEDPENNWTAEASLTVGDVSVALTDESLSMLSYNKTVGEYLNLVADIRMDSQAMTNSTVKLTIRDPTGMADLIAGKMNYDSDYNSETHDQYLLDIAISQDAPLGLIEIETISEYNGNFYVGGALYQFRTIPFNINIKLNEIAEENRTFYVTDQVAINISADVFYGEIESVSAWVEFVELGEDTTLATIDSTNMETNYTFPDNMSGNVTIHALVTHSDGFSKDYKHHLFLVGYNLVESIPSILIKGDELTFSAHIQNSTGINAGILVSNMNATVYFPNGTMWTNTTSNNKQIHSFSFDTLTSMPTGNYSVEITAVDEFDNIYNSSSDVYISALMSNQYINLTGNTELIVENYTIITRIFEIENIAEDMSMITNLNVSFEDNVSAYDVDGNITDFSRFIAIDCDRTTLNYNGKTNITVTLEADSIPVESMRNNLYPLNMRIFTLDTTLVTPININLRMVPIIKLQYDSMNISLPEGVDTIQKTILVNNTGYRMLADPVLVADSTLKNHLSLDRYSNVSVGEYEYYTFNFTNITTNISGNFWLQAKDGHAPISMSAGVPVNIEIVANLGTTLSTLSSKMNEYYENIVLLNSTKSDMHQHKDFIENLTIKIKTLKISMDELILTYDDDVDSSFNEMQVIDSELQSLINEYEFAMLNNPVEDDPEQEPVVIDPVEDTCGDSVCEPESDCGLCPADCPADICSRYNDRDNNQDDGSGSSLTSYLVPLMIFFLFLILCVVLATSIVPEDSNDDTSEEELAQ